MTNRLILPRRGVSRRAALMGGSAGLMGLGLVACGGSSDGGSGDSDGGSASDGGGSASGTINMGYIPSWSDGLSMAYLLENRLTAMGYTIEHTEIAEAGVLYQGLAQGDVDMYPSAWPEVTHKEYMDQHEGDIEDIGSYYENAKLNLSVPDYMDISSIEDLVGQADRFGGQIIGIEPGAGLTAATQDSVMPGYGLDSEYELVLSSTTGMLTELESAVNAEEDIVVTLWTPFWANTTYSVKALEDPEGLFGEAEKLHFLGRTGFEEEFPEAADFISQIKLTDEEYGNLEDKVVNEFGEGKEPEAVEAWLEEYPDLLPAV
ncbi:glycine betaine ABC transporter substrate-binding protein [Brachybacterium sp. GCM10030252]|uniref:glycine betaine ABC transporter substrate-binding protein n=1 Tax=Brachybacterium sp. GCM10030252 TaxID=3273380 RepID=UPI00360F0DE6